VVEVFLLTGLSLNRFFITNDSNFYLSDGSECLFDNAALHDGCTYDNGRCSGVKPRENLGNLYENLGLCIPKQSGRQ